MNWLKTRLREPSTWAGLAILAQGVASVAIDHRNPNAWAALVGGVAAVVAPEGEGAARANP